MRQIHVCAWLLVTCSTFMVACGGEEFSSSDARGTTNGGPSARAGASHDDDDDDGPPPASSGGKNTSISGGQSSGGAATGGASSSGSGNAGGSGGTASGGGPTTSEGGAAPDVECASGSITFRMLPSPDLPDGYFCDTGCGSGWLTITDAEGYTAFSISSACGIASCESCEALPCAAAACLPTPLSREGAKLVWTGTHLSKDTCGQNQACQRQDCVAPGKYKAKACVDVSAQAGEAAGTCAAKNAQACAEVTFDFPAKDTIELVLKKP
jgi:hypothetical protein